MQRIMSKKAQERIYFVSIPLSRDSHCNQFMPEWQTSFCDIRFNPSVEGQPLQPREQAERRTEVSTLFQSLCRGTAIATRSVSACLLNKKSRFQSLCRGTAIATLLNTFLNIFGYQVSIPLSRDSHCNRAVAEALISNGYNRLFF